MTKRTVDFVLSAGGILFFAPLLATVSIAILVVMGRPVLFRQVRAGRGGRPFMLWKFRTMLVAKDFRVNPDEDARRLTRLGALLRATSLDELPSLVNVLMGQMSLVGPRPLLPVYLPRYSAEQRRRQDVLPGLTGWAQIHGRNATTWDERLRCDVWYVDQWSIGLDFRILFSTIAVVIGRQGIAHRGHPTMPEFLGSSDNSHQA